MRPDEFWNLTPGEMTAWVDGFQASRDADRDLALSAAWHTATLQRAKRIPSLQRLLKPPKTRVLTPAEAAKARADHQDLIARMLPEGTTDEPRLAR